MSLSRYSLVILERLSRGLLFLTPLFLTPVLLLLSACHFAGPCTSAVCVIWGVGWWVLGVVFLGRSPSAGVPDARGRTLREGSDLVLLDTAFLPREGALPAVRRLVPLPGPGDPTRRSVRRAELWPQPSGYSRACALTGSGLSRRFRIRAA